MKVNILCIIGVMTFISCGTPRHNSKSPRQISGIYPHLAYYNDEGECGTGAVVPWADRLWVITYGPHLPFGSSDKLYEITPELDLVVRDESIGGTPANRLIHQESNQLFIGPYVIDADRNVRVIPYDKMPGRHTGNARHLFDPGNKIYYGTMEEGFYEVDVKTLEATLLYEDRNVTNKKEKDESANMPSALLYGAHGKGLYSGQGVMVYSNNGESGQKALEQFDIESGSLSEWDGEEWKLIRRNQFVEVTGPGGIYGNGDPEADPIWATGWDHKSVILGVRNPVNGWDFFRLPKASHSYDGAHGWNTEWPRIRNIGTDNHPDYLMTMHGMFWRFPHSFAANNSSGIRPRSAYLKVIGDFARWEDRLVFGCDDSAKSEFLNRKRKQKGGIEAAGQSNSNLWFIPPEKLDKLGSNTASGAVWLKEHVEQGEYSEPFLFAGWDKRMAWVKNDGNNVAEFVFEVDKNGSGDWSELKTTKVEAGATNLVEFGIKDRGEWIRLKMNSEAVVSVIFNYSGSENRGNSSPIFNGLSKVSDFNSMGGLLYSLGDDRRALGVSSVKFENDDQVETGYYELDSELNLVKKEDPETNTFIREKLAIPKDVINVEESSVLVIDDNERRWRLPLGSSEYRKLTEEARLRICREVVTERDLFHASGTFYELPAENADGYAKIRPIATHDFRIHDYASYRGLLVMTGINPATKAGEHIIRSDDGNAAVWLGTIDDLWSLGKPKGVGGPWKNSGVIAGEPSDPYLIGFYDDKYLEISHDSEQAVKFRIEVNPIGHGPWMLYEEIVVDPGKTFEHKFSKNFQARWIRFIPEKNCNATAWLVYK